MAGTATRSTHLQPESGPAERDAADLGLLIFASLERIREQVRLERECQRPTAASPGPPSVRQTT